MKFCDEEDCPIYPYEKKSKQKELEQKELEQKESTFKSNVIYNSGVTMSGDGYTIANTGWMSDIIASPILDEKNIRNIAMKIQIEELDVKIDIKCLMCKYFKKCDMKTELKVYEARKVLEN